LSKRKAWIQIYPKDCYRVLLVLSGETGVSFPKIVNIVVREGLIRLDKIPESTSLASLLVKTPFEPPSRPKTKEEKLEKHLLEQKDNLFKGMWEQWSLHPDPKWRAKAFAEAEKYRDRLQSARKLLELRRKKEEADHG